MLAHSPYQRRGMTLVELMVVVLILGLLAVTVLPNLANSADSRKIREAARAVSSFVAASQSQAISGRSGGGIRIDVRVLGDDMDRTKVQHYAALDVGMVMIPQPYCGDDPGSVVTVVPDSLDSSKAALTFSGGISDSPLTDAENKLLRYLRIRFGGSRIEFMFEPTLGTATGTVYMQDGSGPSNLPNLNQTIDNTSWPPSSPLPPQGAVSYEITAGPLRNGNASLTLGDGVAIDMTYSYIGTNPIFVLNSSVDIDSAVHVLFDSAGVPTSWISDGLKKPFSETLFLLINSVEAIQNNTSLTEPGGYWVAIDPRGGVPKVAEVKPQAAPVEWVDTPEILKKIRDSQEYIRKGLLQTGR